MMEDEGWRTEDGGWGMEDGGWRMEDWPGLARTDQDWLEHASLRIGGHPRYRLISVKKV